MKAIIVQFDGNIPNESALLDDLMLCLRNRSDAECGNITILDDKDVADALIRLTMLPSAFGDLLSAKNVTAECKNPKLVQLEIFCKDLIAKVGATSLKPSSLHNQDVLAFLLKNRDQYKEIIAEIAKVDNTIVYAKHRAILNKYDLAKLPHLLRDINPVLKLY